MKVVKLILVILPALFTIVSGLFKLSGNPELVAKMSAAGLGPYIVMLGIGELVFATLFLIPKTRTIGFLLLICYFSGALATDLSHNSPVIAPIVFLVLLFIAEFVNRPEIFMKSPQLN